MTCRLLLGALIASSLTLGCALTPTAVWLRSGASEEQLWVDRSFCERKAERMQFPGFNPGQALLGIAISNNIFNECMEELGWIAGGEDGSAALVAAPAENPYVTNVKEGARIARREIAGTIPEVPFCSIPLHIENDLLVIRVSQHAARFDLRPGDRILSVDGAPLYTRDDLIQSLIARKPQEVVEIRVRREGTETPIAVSCGDGLPARKRLDAALVAALEGRWNDCMYEASRFEQLTLTASPSAAIRLTCNESRRLTEGTAPDYNDAILVYESTRISLEEAEIGSGATAHLRGTAIANIAWLESNGFQSLADELGPLLTKVENAENEVP